MGNQNQDNAEVIRPEPPCPAPAACQGRRARSFLKRKRFWIATLVSVGVLVLLGWKAQVRVGTIAGHLSHARWGILGATLVFSAAFHLFVGADKWWRILRTLGAPVTYWEVFRVRLGSDPIRFAAPFKAGELVNALYFGRLESLGFSRAAGSVLFDKALNLFGAVFWLYVGFVALARVPMLWGLSVHLGVGLTVLALLCSRRLRWALVGLAGRIHPKLGRFGSGVLSAFEEFTPWQKAGFLTYGILFQLRPLFVCAMMLVAFQPAGAHVPTLREFLAYGSVVVLMSNIPSMGGIGPREAAVVKMFEQFADPATLLTVGLGMSFGVQVLPAILGIPWMFPLLKSAAEFEVNTEGEPSVCDEEVPSENDAVATGSQELSGVLPASQE